MRARLFGFSQTAKFRIYLAGTTVTRLRYMGAGNLSLGVHIATVAAFPVLKAYWDRLEVLSQDAQSESPDPRKHFDWTCPACQATQDFSDLQHSAGYVTEANPYGIVACPQCETEDSPRSHRRKELAPQIWTDAWPQDKPGGNIRMTYEMTEPESTIHLIGSLDGMKKRNAVVNLAAIASTEPCRAACVAAFLEWGNSDPQCREALMIEACKNQSEIIKPGKSIFRHPMMRLLRDPKAEVNWNVLQQRKRDAIHASHQARTEEEDLPPEDTADEPAAAVAVIDEPTPDWLQ